MKEKDIEGIQSHYQKENEKIISPMAETLASFLTHPESKKLSANEKKLESDFSDIFTAQAIQERFAKGFSLIGTYLQKVVSIEELKLILEELKSAGGRLLRIDHEKLDPNIKSLQQVLGICDKTINCMYNCGLKLMEEEHYANASDVFFVLVTLSPYRANPWIALGLSEKNSHNLEEALKAFAVATLIDPSNAIIQIYSAICYRERKDFADALESLKFAEQIIKEHPIENDSKLLNEIKNLRLKIRNLKA